MKYSYDTNINIIDQNYRLNLSYIFLYLKNALEKVNSIYSFQSNTKKEENS